MEATLAILADAANTTANGKLNMLGVFSSLSAPTAPFRHNRLFVVVVLRVAIEEKGTDHKLVVPFLDADMKKMGEMGPIDFHVPPDHPVPNPEIQFILELQDLVIPRFGHYVFQVQVDGKTLRDINVLAQPVFLQSQE